VTQKVVESILLTNKVSSLRFSLSYYLKNLSIHWHILDMIGLSSQHQRMAYWHFYFNILVMLKMKSLWSFSTHSTFL